MYNQGENLMIISMLKGSGPNWCSLEPESHATHRPPNLGEEAGEEEASRGTHCYF